MQAVACSATAIAGAGQFIGLSVITTSGSLTAALVATAVVNLRYVLFASTVSPYLHGLSPIAAGAPRVHADRRDLRGEHRRPPSGTLDRPRRCSGVGVIAWIGWVAGTARRRVRRGLDRRPHRVGGPVRDARDVHRAVRRARREPPTRRRSGVVAGGLALVLAAVVAASGCESSRAGSSSSRRWRRRPSARWCSMSSVSPTVVWGLIIGMAAINFAERFVPMALVSRLELPRPVLRWLSYVPIAVMGSLVRDTSPDAGRRVRRTVVEPVALGCRAHRRGLLQDPQLPRRHRCGDGRLRGPQQASRAVVARRRCAPRCTRSAGRSLGRALH